MIRFVAVTKQYPAGDRPALVGVSLRIEDGEFVFLVGPSGSGKSTLLRLLLREERATSGLVQVDGVDVAAIPDRRVPLLRRTVGCVFQDFRLLPNRTVAGNVAFALDVVGRPRHVVRTVVPEVLGLVGLADRADRYPDELSGGEQQRVAIARAFVGRPRVLLADEPTGNLDPVTSEGIMQLLDAVNRTGTTVIMATHNAGLVDAGRRRVIELADGRCVRDERGGGYGQPTPELATVAGAGAGAGAGTVTEAATGPTTVPITIPPARPAGPDRASPGQAPRSGQPARPDQRARPGRAG